MADVTGKSADLLVEPPDRLREGLDVSFEDVPYPIVPAFTRRPVVHLAVECEGVDWNRGMSVRVLVRTRCGRTNLFADRRGMSWVAECRRCFPPGPDGAEPRAV
ncbi:hypothetical protein [Streptomyces pilosus]|uniref:hypothetical protein n=1 Tax=Streptomyces pilosus TaxID=28893 RepID=UPI00363F9D7A